MSMQADFNIWIIEDRLNEVESYYLHPLEKMAADLTEDGHFPAVHVVMLGVNGVQKRLIKELWKLAPERYPQTRPKFHIPDDDYELRPDDFLQFLQREMGDKDIALIDPTACGLGWPPPVGGGNYLYYIYRQVERLKSEETRDRVLLVSNVEYAASAARATPMNADIWGKIQEKTIGKFKDETDGYDRKFREKLMPFLTPPDEWVEFLNRSGKGEFVEFVERVRRDNRSKAIFESVGRCAKWALLHLLFHDRHCAGDLIEATEGRFYYDPALKYGTSRRPPEMLGADAEMYKVLIRRFVIYGLRAAWDEFCPEKIVHGDNVYMKQNPDHYKLWLEVTAADYFWYGEERGAISMILSHLKKPRLTLVPGGKIDIGTIGLGFRGKDKSVKYAYISGGNLSVRRDAQRFVRYLDGNLSFKYTGETVKSRSDAEGSAKFYYEIRFDGDEATVPHDGAHGKVWDEFWQKTRPKDFFVKRKNHVDKLQSRLANRCYYITLDYMLTCDTPMPEELDWWRETAEEVRKRLANDDSGPEQVFNPELQAESRLRARKR